MVQERLKIESKVELELEGFEYSSAQWRKKKDEQSRLLEYEVSMLKDRGDHLKEKEKTLKKKERLARQNSISRISKISYRDEEYDTQEKENIGSIFNKVM